MANYFENKDRHVLPNWRSFEVTAQLGELRNSISNKIEINFKPELDSLVDDWEQNPSIGIAGDVLSVAVTSDLTENKKIREIATHVLQSHDSSTSMLNTAKRILNKNEKDKVNPFEFNNAEDIFGETTRNSIYNKLHSFRNALIKNPMNPIIWVEMARLYTILGMQEKSTQMMRNALFLAPNNRYVLRAMARYFVHIGDFDFAHENLRQKDIVKYDPWLMATEIETARLRGRSSRYIKKGTLLIEDKNYNPYDISELSSAIGTIEMINGANKRAKKLLSISLKSPNDNAIAQAEWVRQKDSTLFNVEDLNQIPCNPFTSEALTREAISNEDWKLAINLSKQWFVDIPFSKQPITFAQTIATERIRDQKLAVEIAKLGLMSHKEDFQLLNNIAYSLCLDNKPIDAESYLKKINPKDVRKDDLKQVYYNATLGLIQFRKGNPKSGITLYQSAIEKARELKNQYLVELAFVNMSREQLILDCSSENSTTVINTLHNLSKKAECEDIRRMATEVLNEQVGEK